MRCTRFPLGGLESPPAATASGSWARTTLKRHLLLLWSGNERKRDGIEGEGGEKRRREGEAEGGGDGVVETSFEEASREAMSSLSLPLSLVVLYPGNKIISSRRNFSPRKFEKKTTAGKGWGDLAGRWLSRGERSCRGTQGLTAFSACVDGPRFAV